MNQKPEILLVDDDRVMRASYSATFKDEGFVVRTAKNGVEAVAAFQEKHPDVVILDMMMPKMGGLEACQAIRAMDAAVPILFLSCLSDDTKKLRAYDSGADDYVEKTTNVDVIVAKIRAFLRRVASAGTATADDRLHLGAVEVDLRGGEVSVAGAASERLTKTECDILRILAAKRGQTLTCNELIAALRGEGFACVDSMLYSHVSRLRKKLGPASDLLSSASGAGYCLVR